MGSFAVGDRVNYHSVIGKGVTSGKHIIKEISWVAGCAVALITGKSGYVALAALSLGANGRMIVQREYEYRTGKSMFIPKGTLRNVSCNVVEFCCAKMETCWGNVLGFGEYDGSGCNGSGTVNIFQCKPYVEGTVWEEENIAFCPFCGEKIEYQDKGKKSEGE